MSPLLFLPILFIGATALDGSEFYAKSYVDAFRNAMEYKNYVYLNSVVADSYVFKTPSREYNKQEAFELLDDLSIQYPSLSYDFVASNYLDKKQISFSVEVQGFEEPQKSFFRIKEINGKWILMDGFGNLPDLKHRYQAGGVANATVIAQTFLASLNWALESDPMHLTNRADQLFADNFWFGGCLQDYNKNTAIDALSAASNAHVLVMDFKSAKFAIGGDVVYIVLLDGFGEPVDAHFVLHFEKGQYILSGGHIPVCPKSVHHSAAPSADAIAQSFLTSLNAALKFQDQNQIGKMFSDSFYFRSCVSVYNKKKAISALASASKAGALSMDFKSARFANGQDVVYLVNLTVFGVPVESQFVLHNENGQYVLARGDVPICRSRSLANSFSRQFMAETAEGSGYGNF